MLKRTEQEIVEKFREVTESGDDWIGTIRSDLISFLSFPAAKEFLKEGVDGSQFERETRDPVELVRNYLPFAWEKANNCRGISAGRSVDHLKTWLWLAGEDNLAKRLSDVYEFYGKPSLVLASEFVGFDWEKHDNKIWRNNEEDEYGADIERVLIAKGIKRPSRSGS